MAVVPSWNSCWSSPANQDRFIVHLLLQGLAVLVCYA